MENKGPAERGRLDGLHRSQRCIPVCPNLGGPPEIPTVSMARQHLRVPVPPLWPEQRTAGIHQADETGACKAPSSGSSPNYVPGQHVGDGTVQGGVTETGPSGNSSSGATWVRSEQGEIPIVSNSDNTIPWFPGRLQGDENQVDGREGSADHNSLQEDQTEGITVSVRGVGPDSLDVGALGTITGLEKQQVELMSSCQSTWQARGSSLSRQL